MRKPLIVPETKPLIQMLEEFRLRHAHMALVVDEFGTVTGLLTVEDVLEQIVGEIEDEFDERLPKPRAEADQLELDGATSISISPQFTESSCRRTPDSRPLPDTFFSNLDISRRRVNRWSLTRGDLRLKRWTGIGSRWFVLRK